MKLRTIAEAGITYDVPEVDIQVYKETMEEQVYAIHKNILDRAMIGFRVIDIGAHCGAVSLYFWLVWQDSGLPGNFRADCYEPNLHELCKANAARNCKGISVIGKPVTGDGKMVDLVRCEEYPCCTRATPGTEMESVSAQDTLKFITGDIDIVKIDTEGMEVDILRGYGRSVDRFRSVMLEWHSEDDRREIDKLLPNHKLYDMRCGLCKRSDGETQGVAKYIRKDLA